MRHAIDVPISEMLFVFILRVFHFQFHRIPINYLLVNLAVADMMYATFITPKVFFKLSFKHPDGVTGTVFCKLLTDGNVAWVGAASSIVTLDITAIERYYAVMYPLGNTGKLTKRKLKVCSADKF